MGILDSFSRLFGEAPPTPLDPRLARAIAITDPRLENLADVETTLLPPLEEALAYYERTLAILPGPVPLDETSATLARLFPAPDDIQACLGRSMEVKQRLPELQAAGHARLWALLGLRSRAQAGGSHAVFTDHTLRSLAASPAGVREALRDAAWEGLVMAFVNQTQYQQQKLELMRSQKELLQEVAPSSRVRVSGVSQSIDAHISRANKDLAPERVLHNLVEWLGNPEPFLRIENRTGLTLQDGKGTPLLHLPLLSSQDRRQWLVCLVEFPLEMAAAALERESHTHRFIMI